MINYNAALPAMALSGRRGIDVNKWINDVKGNLTAIARSMFAKGEQGFFYDPNDLSTMFQSTLVATPVASAGQPVGIMLDKKAKSYSPYIVNQSTFTDLQGWVVGSALTASVVDGEVLLTMGGTIWATASNWFRPDLPQVDSNTVWEISFDATHVSGGDLEVGAGYNKGRVIFASENGGVKRNYTTIAMQHPVTPRLPCVFGGAVGAVWKLSNIKCRQVLGNHAYQTTSSMRPLLVASPQRLDFDIADDKLITNLPAQLTGCTVIRSVPNVGTQILTNQTIPTPYNDNTDHCGLIVINRALTATETSQITKFFNKAAGV